MNSEEELLRGLRQTGALLDRAAAEGTSLREKPDLSSTATTMAGSDVDLEPEAAPARGRRAASLLAAAVVVVAVGMAVAYTTSSRDDVSVAVGGTTTIANSNGRPVALVPAPGSPFVVAVDASGGLVGPMGGRQILEAVDAPGDWRRRVIITLRSAPVEVGERVEVRGLPGWYRPAGHEDTAGVLGWSEAGRTVEVAGGARVTKAELIALASGVEITGSGATASAVLALMPDGWVEATEGPGSGGTAYRIEDDGIRTEVLSWSATSEDDPSFGLVRESLDASPINVRGGDAWLDDSEPSNVSLVWFEDGLGVWIAQSGPGASADSIVELAEALRPVSQSAWDDWSRSRTSPTTTAPLFPEDESTTPGG